MGCVRCENGAWICTEGTARCDEFQAHIEGWSYVDCRHIGVGTYNVYCKPGSCDVEITTGTLHHPWKHVGVIDVKQGEDGNHGIHCDMGGGTGNACNVGIRHCSMDPDCDC